MSFTPLRIVHAISSLQVGGMEQFVIRIAARQQARGHTVHVLSLRGGPLAAQAESTGLDTAVLDGKNAARRLIYAASYMRQVAPEVVHAHNRSPLRYAALGKALCGSRVVMTRHGQNAARIPRRWEWAFTDGVIAVSHASARVMNSVSPRTAHKVHTIHNGIDPGASKRSKAAMRAELAPTHRVIAIIVARIDHQKGHDTLIRSMARLKEQGVKATLLVVGDGPNRGEMEDLARHLGLGELDIRFLGFRSDVADLLEAADIFVLPSLNEGLPLSVLEAMAHGLPVVATRVGGIPELITVESGILVDCGDVDGLASAIASLAVDPHLRNRVGQAARKRARSAFSFDTMVDEYDCFYQRILRRDTVAPTKPDSVIRP